MHRDHFSRPRRDGGFTLVELLVVIGIIAVLIGILLPSLQRARKAANAVKCAAALKEIGNSFKLYSIDYKGRYPVAKWYIKPASAQPTINGQHVTALYWQDLLAKYVTKSQNLNSGALGSGNAAGFALARNSIFWGCPEWQGRFGGTQATNGLSPYENGYAYNFFCNYTPQTPLGSHPPYSGCAMDDDTENLIVGEWPLYKKFSAERCLVTEANLWLLWLVGTDSSHKVWPQISYNTAYNIGWTVPGWNAIDRYRHGAYPQIRSDGYFDDKKGRVGFNILYGDGHVANAISIAEGVRSIQMRDP